MRLHAAAEVAGTVVVSVVDTVVASVVDMVSAAARMWAAASAGVTSAASAAALASAALAGPTSAALAISAVLGPVSLAVPRVTTSPRRAATSDTQGISAAGVSCRAA